MKVGRLEIADEKMAMGVAALEQLREQYAQRVTVGERFDVPREEGKEAVPVIIYRPSGTNDSECGALPAFFNMHGGAWLGGDAVLMESFCELLAESIPAVVVNVNYHKADVIPISEMSAEVCDCVRYFREHASEYGIDPENMAVGGHSAGANIAAGTVIRLRKCGISLKMQILVYPCVDLRRRANCDRVNDVIASLVPDGNLDEIHMSPMAASDNVIRELCPAGIVACGIDDLKPHAIAYAKRLIDNGVDVCFREYPKAEHGFLETNRPDYEPQEDSRINPEQSAFARDCEQWIIRVLRAVFAE